MTKDVLAAVPKLRFPEFENAPEWTAPQISDLYVFKRTNSLPRASLNYEAGEYKNIHYGDIHTQFAPLFRVRSERVPYVDPGAAPGGFNDKDLCEAGDIVLADASEDLGAVGKAIEVVSLGGERVVAGSHTILATRRGSTPVLGLGGQLFQSPVVRAGIEKEAQGAKVYGISANRILSVSLPLPPTEAEQRKIADCLGSLDALIAAESRKLDALEQHKRGLIQQLFPTIDEGQPGLRFKSYLSAKPWKPRRMSELIQKVSVPVTVLQDRAYREIGVRSHGKGVFHKEPKIGSTIGSKRVFQVIEDALVINIVFAWERSVAVTSADEADMIASHRFPMYVPRAHRCDIRFIRYSLLTQRGANLLRVASPGGAGRNRTLGQSAFAKLKIIVPERDEQTEIANVLDAAEIHAEAQARKVAALAEHKRGLLQQLFPNLDEIAP